MPLVAVAGLNQVFKVTDAGATLRDISDWITDLKLPEDIGMAETTTLGHTAKTVIPTIEDPKISGSGKWDATINGYLVGIKRLVKACEYHPAGTGSGTPKATFNAVLTQFERGGNVSSEISFTFAFQITGGVTWGTNP